MIEIRACEAGDLTAIAGILDAGRSDYERHEPALWKRLSGAEALTPAAFEALLADPRGVKLLAVEEAGITGFLLARALPGSDDGSVAVIEAFQVAAPEYWPAAGAALLARAREQLAELGYRQLVLVSGYRDSAKMVFAREQGLAIASAWLTAPL